MRRAFNGILDLERLLARLSLDSAGPRDVAALAASLAQASSVASAMTAMTSPLWQDLTARLDTLTDIATLVEKHSSPSRPLTLVDGGAIAAGVSAELDELRAISSTGRQSIAAIEERERTRTGIASLKVRYNSVFGYYIEISKSNLANAPADYERKQTLVNAERFTTPELKDYEVKVLTAHDRSIEIEKQLFARTAPQRPRSRRPHPPRIHHRRRSRPARGLRPSRFRSWLHAPRACGRASARSSRRAPSGHRALDGRNRLQPLHSQQPLSPRPTPAPLEMQAAPSRACSSSPAPTWAAKAPISARPPCWS
jgi:hypothetical protein